MEALKLGLVLRLEPAVLRGDLEVGPARSSDVERANVALVLDALGAPRIGCAQLARPTVAVVLHAVGSQSSSSATPSDSISARSIPTGTRCGFTGSPARCDFSPRRRTAPSASVG